jgi:hypothetical protein
VEGRLSSRWRSWPGAAELRGHASRWPPSRRASRVWPGSACSPSIVTRKLTTLGPSWWALAAVETAYGRRPDREAADRAVLGVAGGRQTATRTCHGSRPRRPPRCDRRAGVSHITPRPLRSQPRRAVSAAESQLGRLRHDRGARSASPCSRARPPRASHAGPPRQFERRPTTHVAPSRGPGGAGRGRAP